MRTLFYGVSLAVLTGLSACTVPQDVSDLEAEHTQAVKPQIATPLTAQEDHRRVLDMLGIDKIRPGRNGLNPEAENYANYDESTATPYPNIPTLMTLENGTPVTTPALWKQRRAEIIELFDREIFGREPANVPDVTWEVVSQKNSDVDGIPVTIKELVGRLDNSAVPDISVNIEMTLTTPRTVKGAIKNPVPAIVHFTYKWPAGRPRREPPPGPTPMFQVLSQGWAFAELVPTTTQADNGAGLTGGVIGLANKGQPRELEDWGVLRAWGWSASRALDYFETDARINAKKIGIEGMSRYGKAVLVTMAYDERFAIGFAGSSGAGGASLWRRDIGEIVENVASSGEYHWMAGNFLKYAGPLGWDDLPIDAHELIALSAPRPLFIGSGLPSQGDGWVDPKGMYLATVAATPAYEVLGAGGLSDAPFPAAETSLTQNELAFRQHSGGHTNGPNWEHFLEFAEPYLDK